MPASKHYKIEYLLAGIYKSFYVSADSRDNAGAWNWAAIDAGAGEIPKYRWDKVSKVSKPKAERLGITNVQWSDA